MKTNNQLITLLLIFVGIIFFIFFLSSYITYKNVKTASLFDLKNLADQELIKRILVYDNFLLLETKNNELIRINKESGVSLWQISKDLNISPEKLQKIEIISQNKTTQEIILALIVNLLPVVVIIAIFWYMFSQAQKGAGQIFSFSKSSIKMYNPQKEKITFDDVAGLKEAKEELKEVIEFLKNPQKFLSLGARVPKGVLLVGPPGTGKCVVGETLILTTKGAIEIKEVPKYFYVDIFENKVEGAYLPTIELKTLENVIDKAIYFYALPETQTIKITTRQGFELEGTPEHPILVLNENGFLEFKELQSLKIGDLAAIKFNTQIFGNFSQLTEEEAYIMGVLIGDGNLSTSNRLEITTADRELANVFVNYFKNNYPEYKIYERLQYSKNFNKSIVYGIASWPAKKKFFEYGMSCFLSYDKYIPESIMMGNKKIVTSFLQGLFDSDGYVEAYRGAVGILSVSKKLINQLAFLLLNLGIVPSIRIKQKRKDEYSRDVYELKISGAYLLKFAQEINFKLPRKKKLLENYLYTRWKDNANVDIIYNIGDLAEKAWNEIKQKGKSNSWMANVVDKVRNKNRISRNTLMKLIQDLEERGASSYEFYYLKSLLDSELFFTPIVKKEFSKAKVYDFTMQNTHSFISNGFISHNTLLAKATAAEAGVPFFYISGSEFIELFVGVGASRIRDAFSVAKKFAPSILFIDEIDSIGRIRGVGVTGAHEEREQTLNQLLAEMDGFEKETPLVVIAATNRPDVLDPALLRPGRFDRKIYLDLPTVIEREEILKIHLRDKKVGEVNLKEVAERTPGFSGADLANLCNEAAIIAARKNKSQIEQEDLIEAIEKVLLGPERKSKVYSKKEKMIAAYHEAGHAIVAHYLPYSSPVQKISIIARARAGGYTLKTPLEEKSFLSKKEFLDEICALLGGYAAELIVFNDITTGASSDLRVATDMARELVTTYGMSEKFGPISLGRKQEIIYGYKEYLVEKDYSEKTAEEIDKEVQKILNEALEKAKKILEIKREKLDKVAKALIKRETLEKRQFERLVGEPKGSLKNLTF